MEPESADTDFWGLTAGDLQSGVSVTGNAITGTLIYQGDPNKALVHDWGAGYFLAVKFGGFSEGLTYEDVQVGLDPSEGAGMVTLDEDCNGVFKITDKNTQTLKVVQSDGTHTLTQTFDLSGLTLAPPEQNVIVPNSVTIDKNPDGANYEEKVLTVIPATSNATISKLYLQTGASPDPSSDTEATSNVYTIDSTGLVVTLLAGFAENIPVGSYTAYVLLTDNSTVGITLIVEDTT